MQEMIKFRNIESLEIQKMDGKGEIRQVECNMECNAKFGQRTKEKVIFLFFIYLLNSFFILINLI